MIHNISRYLLTLALLLTAATGAWAQGAFSSDPYTSTREFNSVSVKSSMTLNINEGVIVTVNSGLTIEDGVTLTLTGGGRLSVFGKSGNWGMDASYDEGTRINEATAGEDGKPAIILNDNAKIVIDNGEIYAEGGQGGFGGTDATAGINQPDGAAGNAFSRFPTIDGATLYYKSSNEWFKYTSGDQTLYNKMKAVPATFEVTINDTKTEASFDMPTYDMTVDYELVRDIDYGVGVTVNGEPTWGEGDDSPRFLVKKNGEGKYQPETPFVFELKDLFLDQNNPPVLAQSDYTLLKRQRLDEDGTTWNDLAETDDYQPGIYCIAFIATETSAYDGTVFSGEFEIYAKNITVDPVAATGLVYNGQPQALASEAECEGGEMRYSLDGETWSAQMPTVTDAGTYTLYYKVVTGDDDPDTNYSMIENIVVAKAELASATLVNATLIYDTFNHLPLTAEVSEVKAGEDGSLTVPAEDYTIEGNVKTDMGDYTATITAKADSKNFTGSTTVDFSIVKEVIEVDEENVPVEVTADPEAKTLTIDKIMQPKNGAVIHIPAEINGYKVTKIAAGALDVASGVTDIWMPDTEEPIVVEAGALSADATIHTTLALLDDYALMSGLKPNYEGTKVMTTVTAKNRLWTLGTGCDVILPDGLTASTVQLNNTAEVQTLLIPEQDLNLNALTDTRVVKAYNGVLISGAAGQSYDLVAYSQRIASGTAVNPATIKKDYGANILEPVIEPTDYPANGYYVLKDNEFHKILDNHSLVPAGKAVLHTSANAARVLRIVGDAVTGVDTLNVERGTLNDNSFYDLNGRKLDEMPTKKGVYIQNGKKVVVK